MKLIQRKVGLNLSISTGSWFMAIHCCCCREVVQHFGITYSSTHSLTPFPHDKVFHSTINIRVLPRALPGAAAVCRCTQIYALSPGHRYKALYITPGRGNHWQTTARTSVCRARACVRDYWIKFDFFNPSWPCSWGAPLWVLMLCCGVLWCSPLSGYMFISLAYVDWGRDSHAPEPGAYPSKSTALIRIAALTTCFPF